MIHEIRQDSWGTYGWGSDLHVRVFSLVRVFRFEFSFVRAKEDGGVSNATEIFLPSPLYLLLPPLFIPPSRTHTLTSHTHKKINHLIHDNNQIRRRELRLGHQHALPSRQIEPCFAPVCVRVMCACVCVCVCVRACVRACARRVCV